MSSNDMSGRGLLMLVPILNVLMLRRVSNWLPLSWLNSKKYDTHKIVSSRCNDGKCNAPQLCWVRRNDGHLDKYVIM